MASFIDPILDSVDNFLAWLGNVLKQTNASYCDLETADSRTVLVGHDGSLVSVVRVAGSSTLIGAPEFEQLQTRLLLSWQTALSRPGHAIQVFFNYDRDGTREQLDRIFAAATETAKRLNLELDDVFKERLEVLNQYCTQEEMFLVIWTRPWNLTKDQYKRIVSAKRRQLRKQGEFNPVDGQNLAAAIIELREGHESLVRAIVHDLLSMQIIAELMDVHNAVYEMRRIADPEFTDLNWRPYLPGDKIPLRELKHRRGDISELMCPTLSTQIMPRDGENIDLRTTRLGDRIYTSVFIELFPKEVQDFISLFSRTLPTQIPWRISYLLESGSVSSLRLRSLAASLLGFTSAQNRLIYHSLK
jgi:intracellular multiplication protein IcmB